MLEKIHKFANATSRPIARYGIMQPRNEPKCGVHEYALVAQL